MEAFAAAIDWGTTNMRLWLLDAGGRVLAERSSDEGMRACMPDHRFEAVMEAHLAALGAPSDLPAIVAGMAGARGAWREAAYLEVPASLGDLAAHAVRVEAARDVRILPGVCQRGKGLWDVMRGEETQLAGAVAGGQSSGLFCLPGTHSKWAKVEEGRLTRYTTFMTGELFALLGQHSILRDTLGEGTGDPASADFREAVEEMLSEGAGITGKLFSIRAAGLLGAAAEDAKARLSGLLVGAEVAAARHMCDDGAVTLVAAGAQARAYEAAFAIAGIECRTLDGQALVRQGLFNAAAALWPERRRT